MVLVIAATYQGFLHFCEAYGLVPDGQRKGALYVENIDKLRGYSNRLVLLAPGWWLGRGGSSFAKSCDRAGVDCFQLKTYFPRLKFLEVL